MGRIARALALLALAALTAAGGQLTGVVKTPLGLPLAGATLTFTLSQVAYFGTSYAVAPATAACGTDAGGNIVGLNAPPAPTVGATSGAFTLPAGNYFVEITYSGDSGETAPSTEVPVTLNATGYLVITLPNGGTLPPGATATNIYIGTTSGGETKQASTTGATYSQQTPLASGSAVPASNTTQCNFAFNDALLPTATFYTLSIADASGNALPGYPQNYYFVGTTEDLAAMRPIAGNPAVSFPMPLLANPPTSASQSVGSGLQLNGFPLNGAANVGPGYIAWFWSGAMAPANFTMFVFTPNVTVVARRVSAFAQTPGSGGASGITVGLTQGTGFCEFTPGLLPGAAASSSSGGTFTVSGGSCTLQAGVPVTVESVGDDHSTRAANVGFLLEVTSQ